MGSCRRQAACQESEARVFLCKAPRPPSDWSAVDWLAESLHLPVPFAACRPAHPFPGKREKVSFIFYGKFRCQPHQAYVDMHISRAAWAFSQAPAERARHDEGPQSSVPLLHYLTYGDIDNVRPLDICFWVVKERVLPERYVRPKLCLWKLLRHPGRSEVNF